MKILISGGAGFIASHIVDAYITMGHAVVIIDNMVHGFEHNINPNATFYNVDIRDLAKVREVIQNESPNIINHHAAIAEVVQSVKDPTTTLDVNVNGTVNLLLAGAEIGIRKFIFASTGGAIYGEALERPTNESAKTLPLSPYGLSKLLGEEVVHYYSRMYGFTFTIFRYPNVYGPRQDPMGEAGVVAIFTQLLKSRQQATIFGDGTKTRDYTYINDIVKANELALAGGDNYTINLGNGKEISDTTVFEAIHSFFPDAPAVRYEEVRPGEVMHSALDASLANTILGWQPTYTFTKGVTDYIKATE